MPLPDDHQRYSGSRRDPSRKISFAVDSILLDQMAADDEARSCSAEEELRETKEITLAERYLRLRFR